MTATGWGEWAEAMRSGHLQRAWEINDSDLREYCNSGAIKYAGERHLQRIWRGENLHDQRVLVRCYHGLGDTIQFIRFAKPLREIAREVILWAQPELLGLLCDVEGIDRLYPLHDEAPDFSYDVDIEIMELAHALRVTASLVAERVPYLRRCASKPRNTGAVCSVGLVWEAGNWDRNRSLPPRLLRRLLVNPGVRLFSLQQGPARNMGPAVPAEDIGEPDLDSLAKIILGLDLIITVDTMVAHLAGALGAPVWTVLQTDCDWRWSKTESRSIWYPSMKLFHQHRPGEWAGVIEQVAQELDKYSTGILQRNGSRHPGHEPKRVPLPRTTA